MFMGIFYRKIVVGIILLTSVFVFGLITYHNHRKTNIWIRRKLDYAASSSQSVWQSIVVGLHFNEKINPPGVILHTKGGIGNQLFQYACSYALARDLGWPLYYVDSSTSFDFREFQPRQREFALDQFQISLENLIRKTTILSKEVTYQNDQNFLEKTFINNKDIDKQFIQLTGNGYCQSIEYWRNYQDDIKTMFKLKKEAIDFPKIQKIINKIENTSESVVVHVRRGDFLKLIPFKVPISYQRRAIRKIINILNERGKEKPVFFVFSDDIGYVEKKLKDFEGNFEMVFVSQEISDSTSIEEFYLMTLCKHVILPNSTFSWWAAYLINNLEKIVIASAFNPKFFENVTNTNALYLYGKLYHPKEWIVIDPFTGGLARNVSKVQV